MSYTKMIPFDDGQILTAHKLNRLSRNTHYLYSVFRRANIPFGGMIGGGDEDDSPATNRTFIRHKHQYLHIWLDMMNISTGDLALYYGGIQIGGWDETQPSGFQVFDLSDTGIIDPTPTANAWYEINFWIDVTGGTPGVPKWQLYSAFEYPYDTVPTGTPGGTYAAPKIWQHGDIPTASEFNKYSDSLNYLDARTGGFLNYATTWAPTNTPLSFPVSENSGYYFFHLWPWLHYMGESATLRDPLGLHDEISLPDTEGTIMQYDLAQVPWLSTGRKYYVNAAVMASEEPTA